MRAGLREQCDRQNPTAIALSAPVTVGGSNSALSNPMRVFIVFMSCLVRRCSTQSDMGQNCDPLLLNSGRLPRCPASSPLAGLATSTLPRLSALTQ
jgi:hypothetical protein